MRELNSESGLSDPFSLARREELIDYTLGRVDEVSELSFPNDVGMGIDHRVSQLKSHHGVLRKGRVTHRIFALKFSFL